MKKAADKEAKEAKAGYVETLEPTCIDVVVAPSKIHGMGVFSTRTLPPGHLIGVYGGRVSYDLNHKWTLWLLDSRGAYFGVLGDNALRYMNHSTEPNAEADGPHIYALEFIKPGDEITISYDEDWEAVESQ